MNSLSSLSCRASGTDFPLSFAIRLYHPSLPAGLPGYFLCPYIAVVDKFSLVRPTFARPCERVNKKTSLMSSYLLLQQCPACLVSLIWMVFEMDGRWPYSYCFVGCCFQDLLSIARSILAQLLSSFFSIRLVSVRVAHPYSSRNTTATWKRPIAYR